MNVVATPSIRRRYVSKLASSFVGLILGMVNSIIVPRVLGAALYGDFNFLRNSFRNLFAFMDMGVSSAHLTYVSKNRESGGATHLGILFWGGISLALLLLVGVSIATGYTEWLWPGQEKKFIMLAYVLGFAMFALERLTDLADGKGVTVNAENIRIAVSFLGILTIVLMYYSGYLDMISYFWFQIGLYLLNALVFYRLVRRLALYGGLGTRLARAELRKVARYYYDYAHPIFTMTVVGFMLGYFDRWFLQLVGGSVAQGYFSLALNFSYIIFLFTGSLTPIFQQSIASAHGEGDADRIRTLVKKIQLIYYFTAAASILFLLHIDIIVAVVGKEQYQGAIVPLAIMSLYPIHQTYGQMAGSAIMSTDRTHVYRNVGIISSIMGILLTYLLIAPANFAVPGLALGAVGLALKNVLIQIISVNLLLYDISRVYGISIKRNLMLQAGTLFILFPIGYISLSLEKLFFSGGGVMLTVAGIAASGMLFAFMCAALLVRYPGLAGLARVEMTVLVAQVRQKIGI